MLNRDMLDAVVVGRNSGRVMIELFGLNDEISDLTTPILTGNLYISISKKSNVLHLIPTIEKLLQEEDYCE